MDRTCILNESQISTKDGGTECDTGIFMINLRKTTRTSDTKNGNIKQLENLC